MLYKYLVLSGLGLQGDKKRMKSLLFRICDFTHEKSY